MLTLTRLICIVLFLAGCSHGPTHSVQNVKTNTIHLKTPSDSSSKDCTIHYEQNAGMYPLRVYFSTAPGGKIEGRLFEKGQDWTIIGTVQNQEFLKSSVIQKLNELGLHKFLRYQDPPPLLNNDSSMVNIASEQDASDKGRESLRIECNQGTEKLDYDSDGPRSEKASEELKRFVKAASELFMDLIRKESKQTGDFPLAQ